MSCSARWKLQGPRPKSDPSSWLFLRLAKVYIRLINKTWPWRKKKKRSIGVVQRGRPVGGYVALARASNADSRSKRRPEEPAGARSHRSRASADVAQWMQA